MEDEFRTPLRSPRKSVRNTKPSSPRINSPYEVVDIDLSVKDLKARILEQDEMIRNLQKAMKSSKDDMLSSTKITESILIETSNKFSDQENRLYRHDIELLRSQIATLREQLQSAIDDLTSERDFRIKEVTKRDLEVGQLRNELRDALIKVDNCEKALQKSLDDLNGEKSRTNELLNELHIIKKSRDECERRCEKLRIETDRVAEKTKSTASISTASITPSSTSLAEIGSSQRRIGELQTTNVYLEKEITGYQTKHQSLLQQLEISQDALSTTRSDLSVLQSKLVEIEGNAELTHKFLIEESEKLKRQKADIRWELIELKKEHAKAMEQLQKGVQMEGNPLDSILSSLQEQVAHKDATIVDLEKKLSSVQDELEVALQEKSNNSELRRKIDAFDTQTRQLADALQEVDSQCEQFRKLKKRAEEARDRALNECSEMTIKVRELERDVERLRPNQAEVLRLRTDRDRLEKKIEYLKDELRETHTDYREELARLAKEVSDKAHTDTSNATVSIELDETKAKLSQTESVSKSLKRQADEYKADNEKLLMQITDSTEREKKTSEEVGKLRNGLSDALAKIETYRRESEQIKELNNELALKLADNEEKIASLEDELSETSAILREKDRLVSFLQTQINTKQMPKVSRRSTLLRAPSTSSIMEVIQPEVVEKLENERAELLRQLDEKRKKLNERKEQQPVRRAIETSTTTPLREQSKSASEVRTPLANTHKAMTLSAKMTGTMRHDIPHRWKDLGPFRVFSIKCAVCFMAIPSLGKARRCQHCQVAVHAHCGQKVVNTCGLPDECANFACKNAATTPQMNGWIKLFIDDGPREWLSAWALLEENTIAFHDNESVNSDLGKAFLKVELSKESWVVRTGQELPLKSDDALSQANNLIQIKMQRRSVYMLSPSSHVARRWVDALQSAERKKMMLTRRPTSFSEQSCMLVLQGANNMTVHAIAVIDDFILIGAQAGLFFTSASNPRVPVPISGVASVSAMECLTDLNMLVMIVGAQRVLCFTPLSSLRSALCNSHPSIYTDSIPGYDHLHLIMYHKQDSSRFLCVVDATKIDVLKYNPSRDMFSPFQAIRTNEPSMCIESVSGGFYFGSDTFYFVDCSVSRLEERALISSHVADYPIAVCPISEQEVLLAYQNYGIFADCTGKKTRNQMIEWEHMPMEFAYTAPYLYIIHFDSIEIVQLAAYNGPSSGTLSEEREVYECMNAHIARTLPNGDVFISISGKEMVELHRFNATSTKRSSLKRKALAAISYEKRSKSSALIS